MRALLAYLALEADRPHEREHLCGLLWPAESLPTALANLRQALHRLRQALEPAGEDEGRYLLITRQSVQLRREAIELDTARFEAALVAGAAHRHRSAAGCALCAARLREALGLYRGELLAGFGFPGSEQFEEWLHFERERLRGRLAELLGTLAAHDERRGELQSALELLRRWAQTEPLSEQAQLRLIAALAQTGQRAQALRQFERYKAYLAAELGVEPGPEVQRLLRQVLGGGPPPRESGPRRLPIDTAPFFGRDPELLRLGELLGDPSCRLLTLTGIGGSGKTRLAIAAARANCHAFADGVDFISLVTARHARQLPEVLAEALELRIAPGRPLLDQVAEALKSRELLLVLDNCEQVAELAAMLSHLLAAAPRLTVLATSRAPLDLRAEWVVNVEGLRLPAPEAVPPPPASYAAGQLFMQVARQVRSGFALGADDAALVLACCQLLGGTPLGIELAASQLRSRRLDEVVAGLRADIDSLTTTMGDVHPRHRSLRAVFDWSWRLLDSDAQQSLARMAVFVGGCTTSAAHAICGPAAPLDQLVASSMLYRDEDGRYWMHEQTRQFAEKYLSASGQADEARACHSAYYLELAASYAELVEGPQAGATLGRLKVKYGNLLRAWRWAARNRDYARLAAAAPLFRQIYARSDLAEGVLQFAEALACVESDQGEAALARQQLLDGLVFLLRGIGQIAEAQQRAYELLALARRLGEPVSEAAATLHLAELALEQCDFAGAWNYLSLANQLSIDEPSRRARMVRARALLKQASLIDVQQLPVDTSFAEQAYAIYSELEMPIDASRALNRLGNQHRRSGDYGRSIAARQQAVALIGDQGDHEFGPYLLNDLGDLYTLLGSYGEARAIFERALAMARRIGMHKSQVNILEGLARCLVHLGELRLARGLIEEALALSARFTRQMHRGYYLSTLGSVAEHEGNWSEAAKHYGEALGWWQQSSHSSDALSEAHAGLVRVALARNDLQTAMAHAEAILPFLAGAPLKDTLAPMLVHWSCYRALRDANDLRAAPVLAQARALIRAQAAQIDHPQLRDSFLNGVVAHRELMGGAGELQPGYLLQRMAGAAELRG